MQHEFIRRQIQRSLAGGANLLIFEINSPGGTLYDSTNLAYTIAACDPKDVRTVAYVPNEAISGGAIVARGAAAPCFGGAGRASLKWQRKCAGPAA